MELEKLDKPALIEIISRKDQLIKELGADLANSEIAKKEAEINYTHLLKELKELKEPKHDKKTDDK